MDRKRNEARQKLRVTHLKRGVGNSI